MYFIILILSLVATIVAAKLDKHLTAKLNGDFEKDNKWDEWFLYYNGRKSAYKICMVLSFIPLIQFATVAAMILLVLVLVLVKIVRSNFWSKSFWDKLL